VRRLLLDIPRLTALLLTSAIIVGLLVDPVGAQSLDEIASDIDGTGRYVEVGLEAVADEAVERANADGIAFVYLDQENAADLPIIANGLLQRLEASGSRYRSLIVLDSSGVWVESFDADGARAADAATAAFARGAVATGVDTVAEVLGGGTEAASAGNQNANAAASDTAASDTPGSTSGGGVPWLLIIVLGVAVFLVVRFVIGRRRRDAALEAELAEDRAEIREQLRNNADHVIDLGDRIVDADDELRRLYEEAAQTFQDVSLGLDDAATAAEIDALDDRLDRADWLFDVIEARLDGRTPPPEPRADDAGPPPPAGQVPPPPAGRSPSRPGDRQPVPPLGDRGPRRPTGRSGRERGSDRPALGDDESLFPGSSPNRRSGGRPRPRRRGGAGGMLGGVAKAGLMALVMRLLFGGGLGVGNTSRRTQQRRSHGGGASGGLGRGVLR
jgi:hypothetical protein